MEKPERGISFKIKEYGNIENYLDQISTVIKPDEILSIGTTGPFTMTFFVQNDTGFNNLIDSGGFTIDGIYYQYFPYMKKNKTKVVYVKGAPPFITNAAIEEELRKHCNLNGGLRKLRVKARKDIYAHIDTYTRQVPIIVKPEESINLPSHVEVKYNERTFKIKVELGSQRCHRCKLEGHFVKNCPTLVNGEDGVERNDEANPQAPPEVEISSQLENDDVEAGTGGHLNENLITANDLNFSLDQSKQCTPQNKRTHKASSNESPPSHSTAKFRRTETMETDEDSNCSEYMDGLEDLSETPSQVTSTPLTDPPNVYQLLNEIQFTGSQPYTTEQVVTWLKLFLRKKSYDPSKYYSTMSSLGLESHKLRRMIGTLYAKTDPTWRIRNRIQSTHLRWPLTKPNSQ